MKTEAARCAQMIRTDLKTVFPTIKFSVRSSLFAGGDAVDIEWTDGPTPKQVEAITDKYADGYFDGMIDCYEYSPNPENLPRAKYVHTRRELSEEFRKAISEAKGIPLNDEWENQNAIWRKSQDIDWTTKQKLLTIEELCEQQERERLFPMEAQ